MIDIHSRKNSFSVILPLREGVWPDRPDISIILSVVFFVQPIQGGDSEERSANEFQHSFVRCH